MRTELILCFLVTNAFAISAYAIHSNAPNKGNPIKPPLVVPSIPGALPSTPATGKTASSPDAEFAYGGKSVDGSALEKPSAQPPLVTEDGVSPTTGGDSSMPVSSNGGAATADGASGAGGGTGTMMASSGANSYYGNMDLVKDIKGFSQKEDLKTGVVEKFIDPQTGRRLAINQLVTGRRVLMVTPDGRTVSGQIDIGLGQGLALSGQNVKNPNFSYSQIVGASRNFITSRVLGFLPDQPTSMTAIGMKSNQVDYYAADPPTIAKIKTQGASAEMTLYALKVNSDGSIDVIGGGGGGAGAKAKAGPGAAPQAAQLNNQTQNQGPLQVPAPARG